MPFRAISHPPIRATTRPRRPRSSAAQSIAADHSKYSGSGFVANLTTVGSGVTFTVNAAQAGPQPVHLRYSNGPNPSVKTKLVSLIVNGTEVDPLALPSTTDWKTWAFATRELNLNAGSNTITLRYDTGDDGWVNIDVLKVGTERDICSPQPAGAGYTSLFDGTLDSLTGWRQASAGSFARQPDCSLKTVGNAGMLWWPGDRFDKYSLKLDWKLAGDDNSGVFVGFPDPGNDWNVAFTRGHEVQIDATDDADSTTGSIYNYSAPDAAARDAALNPPGQWNAYEIIVEGQRIQVFLNGVKINDYTNTDPNRMTVPGFIGVQNHAAGDDVFFRNIRLKKLDQGENAAPVIETATATPASGPAPLAVSFAATATDPDGDSLTYAWDLDGDGTFETNGQTPSRTYDTPRLYAPAVRVTDPDGASATRTLAVSVQPATTKTEVPGSVGGTVPGVLALSLGASANLGAFMPGVDRDYTGSLTGTVTSSAGAAALTVHDPSTTATGRLVNGPWSLPQPLQMRAGSGAFAPLSSPVLHCR